MIKFGVNDRPDVTSILPEHGIKPEADVVSFPSLRPHLRVQHTRWIEIPRIIDGEDGILSVAEGQKNIPFNIKRVYYIYSLQYFQHVQRGKHAHKTLEQVLFCINGRCKVILNDGSETQEVILSRPHSGIYLGPRLWHVMHSFEDNCILLVFASDFFNEEDYIRNFDDYLEYLRRP